MKNAFESSIVELCRPFTFEFCPLSLPPPHPTSSMTPWRQVYPFQQKMQLILSSRWKQTYIPTWTFYRPSHWIVTFLQWILQRKKHTKQNKDSEWGGGGGGGIKEAK